LYDTTSFSTASITIASTCPTLVDKITVSILLNQPAGPYAEQVTLSTPHANVSGYPQMSPNVWHHVLLECRAGGFYVTIEGTTLGPVALGSGASTGKWHLQLAAQNPAGLVGPHHWFRHVILTPLP
jgi:hypothetical protein